MHGVTMNIMCQSVPVGDRCEVVDRRVGPLTDLLLLRYKWSGNNGCPTLSRIHM